ncbi:MAG TPA: Holliday junction branch migration protein RuvA [Humisphaera sp.]|jgi:Holliday junction DNA helicase RuvA|nr:Holliday junction branch migration protein RuvA [Humisphaera sp.]
MISALTGELRRVDEDRIHLQVGPLMCEMLIAAADLPLLRDAIGSELTFHTVMYIEGDASGGNLEPRLIGFLQAQDKAFFQLFITVKGIGPRKALKALALPAGEIAQAIESRDSRFLVGLPQIGKRMAEQIIAELAGKAARFATPLDAKGKAMQPRGRRLPVEEDAIATLMALGERRTDAEQLLDRVRQSAPDLKTTDAFVHEMLRMRNDRG